MAIYLLRHAETDGNATRVVQLPGVPLSERGRQQAARLAARLADAGITRIVSSDLARAVETAEALRAMTDAPVEIDPALAERNFADVRGRPHDALPPPSSGPPHAPPAERAGPPSTPASTRPGRGCCASRPRPRDTSRS